MCAQRGFALRCPAYRKLFSTRKGRGFALGEKATASLSVGCSGGVLATPGVAERNQAARPHQQQAARLGDRRQGQGWRAESGVLVAGELMDNAVTPRLLCEALNNDGAEVVGIRVEEIDQRLIGVSPLASHLSWKAAIRTSPACCQSGTWSSAPTTFLGDLRANWEFTMTRFRSGRSGDRWCTRSGVQLKRWKKTGRQGVDTRSTEAEGKLTREAVQEVQSPVG